MAETLRRPCEVADVLEIATDYRFGWGPPWSQSDDLDWSFAGRSSGFDPWGIVETDRDWDSLPPDETVRYVVVWNDEQWELRWGRVSTSVVALQREVAERDERRRLAAMKAQAELDRGVGTHRLMFSRGEVERAEASGHPIKSGYVYRIRPESISLD